MADEDYWLEGITGMSYSTTSSTTSSPILTTTDNTTASPYSRDSISVSPWVDEYSVSPDRFAELERIYQAQRMQEEQNQIRTEMERRYNEIRVRDEVQIRLNAVQEEILRRQYGQFPLPMEGLQRIPEEYIRRNQEKTTAFPRLSNRKIIL